MKKNKLYTLLLICFGILLAFPSCSNDDDDKLKNLEKEEQDRYNEFVTPEMQEALTALEVPINRGINPPKIEGYYRMEALFLATTNKNENYLIGSYLNTDYKFNFYDQKGLSISLLGYEVLRGSDKYDTGHVGKGVFITGHDDLFSVFLEEEAIYTTGRPKILTVISGEVQRKNNNITGIKYLRYAFLMKDTDGVTTVIKEGQGRMVGDDNVDKITKEQFEYLINGPSTKMNIQEKNNTILSTIK